MNDESKIDPDELLKKIQKEEEEKKLGKLKIFFGMSAGVGKTYAMLEEARQLKNDGINVAVGIVNTHGRQETAKLLEGLSVIPEKWVNYKDALFSELDLEKILELKPEVVLVDELAHTNVPGSKHLKRWQDVMEILDAGINVLTTLNVQHIESRKDIVENITGVSIRETVPDLVLERADSIELIDLPPASLIRRLREGKVYLADQSILAEKNFFKEDNLTALRELALRFTAEKVDHDLHGILSRNKGWATREKLLVIIDSHPKSQITIRAARKIAFQLDAPWVVVYIDKGFPLTTQQKERLNSYMNLALDLGAEVVNTKDISIASAVNKIVRQKNITRIIISRDYKKQYFFFGKSLIDRLAEENKDVDLMVLREDKITQIFKERLSVEKIALTINPYLLVTAVISITTLLASFLDNYVSYKVIGYLFFLIILSLSFFLTQGPILYASILSSLSWIYLFIKPSFQFTHLSLEDIVLIAMYLITGSAIGVLATRLRKQDQILKGREEKSMLLFEIEKEIFDAPDLEVMRKHVDDKLATFFEGNFDVLTVNTKGQLDLESRLSLLDDEREQSAAIWSFQNGKQAGWSTNTLPSAKGLYLPILRNKKALGVLVYKPQKDEALSNEEINFLQIVTQQIGVYLDRRIMEWQVTTSDISRQVEKIQTSILHSLSQSFYRPLNNIIRLSQEVKEETDNVDVYEKLDVMSQLLIRLKFVINNILSMSRLESGFIQFVKKKNSLPELLSSCIKEVEPLAKNKPILTELPQRLQLISFDAALLKIAIINLLINSLENSPEERPIIIQAQILDNNFVVTVLDEGSGIADDMIPTIFEKFYQIPKSTSMGIGLGLSIVKIIVDIHQGAIELRNRKPTGMEVQIILPID
ncbi:Sensor protein KdpD [Candidatus Rubidus massiliensis]|nr:Sensor protein KdpD [Candidatus Rubidus massiliensis]